MNRSRNNAITPAINVLCAAGLLVCLSGCSKASRICNRLADNDISVRGTSDREIEQCTAVVSDMLDEATNPDVCEKCFELDTQTIRAALSLCSELCFSSPSHPGSEFQSERDYQPRPPGLFELISVALTEAMMRKSEAARRVERARLSSTDAAQRQEPSRETVPARVSTTATTENIQNLHPAAEPAAEEKEPPPALNDPRLWQPGNRWVFNATRAAPADKLDEAALYDLFFVMEGSELSQGDSEVNVNMTKRGGIWKDQKLHLTVDENCIRRQLKSGETRPIFCRQGATEETLYVIGQELDVLKFVHDNTTTYFSFERGIVKRVFELKNGRTATETLTGFTVADRRGGEYDKLPFTCEWARKRSMEKHGALVEQDTSSASSSNLEIVQQTDLLDDYTTSISSRLKANRSYKKIVALTDDSDTVIAFLDNNNRIKSLTNCDGKATFLKALYDDSTQTDLVVVGVLDSADNTFVAHLYRINADGVASATVGHEFQAEAKLDVHLMADQEKCFLRLVKSRNREFTVADLEISWPDRKAYRTRGTLEIESPR